MQGAEELCLLGTLHIYGISIWNIHTITLENRSATNNAREGWYNRFAQMLERTTPDLFTLLEGLKSEQEDAETGILEFRMSRRIKMAPKKMDRFAK